MNGTGLTIRYRWPLYCSCAAAAVCWPMAFWTARSVLAGLLLDCDGPAGIGSVAFLSITACFQLVLPAVCLYGFSLVLTVVDDTIESSGLFRLRRKTRRLTDLTRCEVKKRLIPDSLKFPECLILQFAEGRSIKVNEWAEGYGELKERLNVPAKG